MIKNSVIFSNPVILPSYYCAKVCKLEQEPSGYFFPKLLIYLQIHPDQLENTFLTSLIHPTPAYWKSFNNFRFTFLKDDNEDYECAVGRYGVIQVFKQKNMRKNYSVVKFVEQCGEYREMVEKGVSEEK